MVYVSFDKKTTGSRRKLNLTCITVGAPPLAAMWALVNNIHGAHLTAHSGTPTFESPIEPCQLSPICTLFDLYMLIKPRLRDKNV